MKRIGVLGEFPASYQISDLRVERKGFLKILSFQSSDVKFRLEMMERGCAAFTLPVDFARRLVYLMRAPRHLRFFAFTDEGRAAVATAIKDGVAPGPFEVPADVSVVWGVPAGVIEPGEDGATTAFREMIEETGVTADGPQQRVGSVTASIGGTTEVLELFIAPVTTLQEHVAPEGDGTESTQVYQMTFEELFALHDAGEIPNAADFAIVERLRRIDGDQKAVARIAELELKLALFESHDRRTTNQRG